MWLVDCETFEFDGGLGLVIDMGSLQHNGCHRVEEPSATGGKRRVDATLDHAAQDAGISLLRCQEIQNLRRFDVEAGMMQVAESHAPGFADGGFAAGHGDVVEVGKSIEAMQAADEHFPAPDAPVDAVAGAIEGEADGFGIDSKPESMLGHASGYMGMMMLDRDETETAFSSPLFGPFGGEVTGMQIVDDCLGLNFKCAHEMVEGLAKEIEAGEIFKIAEVLALIDEAAAREGEGVFEMASDGEQRRGPLFR